MRTGPLETSSRALGPDLARGLMLLFIALANTHYFLRAPSVLGGYPRDGSAVDRAVTWLLATFVDGRAFPMFGLLFGYGVARIVHRQIVHRQAAPHPAAHHPEPDRPGVRGARRRDRRAVRRLLWRRAAALIVIGLVDAVLFYVGDILAAYGVLLFIGAWLVFLRDRWLIVVAVVFFVLTALPNADLSVISPAGPDAAMLPTAVSALIPDRLPVALLVAALGPLGFLCPFAIGLLAGRRRILEHPDRHRRLLPAAAAGGLGAAVLGAQPIALLLAGVTTPPAQPALEQLAALHGATGTLGGLGYAALLSLVALRLRRPGPVSRAVAAAGQRSMTCYLLQSVTWAVVFTPFLLDLSGTLTVTGTAVLATATWLATVLIADRMRAAGHRGPFETLTRRCTYGWLRVQETHHGRLEAESADKVRRTDEHGNAGVPRTLDRRGILRAP
ncbi:hypothetical protein Ait01nite_094010 [Actinoplanes italicus]|uniref:Putative membrane protein YeiB n=1 Tax=Actinoplanes italicus TaxID=113567 RepID=A0A2T0JPB7_9ACTN|nr:DUF418 domain-containing protein [Actinoplanes italicus]PRX09453.1 putative membrane protein YeiB [Actinoplanes italicus]GIE36356.1 hypothetical protein Ait01nite_094010 [Actinoplanes italicus]